MPDVSIAGAGIGGAVLALALARRGREVAVLEREAAPARIVRQLEGMDPADSAEVLRGLSRGAATKVVEHLNASAAGRILGAMAPERARELLRETSPKTASAILQQLPSERREAILGALPEADAKRLKDQMRFAAFLNGLWIALLAGGVAWVWFGAPAIALAIALAMIVSMISAALLATVVPLVLKAFGRDPAQASSIFLTTLTDIIGFGSFLSLGGMFLKGAA